MKVGIIGAGFTGLAAADALIRLGVKVTVFEKAPLPGGLALGFKDPSWDWPLEAHYHHLFTSDSAILNLAQAVGVPINFYRPQTSTYWQGRIYQLDSPRSLLTFPGLKSLDRLRTGIGLAALKFNPFWQPLESITAKHFIISTMGKNSWTVLWEPLFRGK